MPKFIVTFHGRPGFYDGAQLYKPGEAVFIDPKDYKTKLPAPWADGRPGPLAPTDREGALALGWSAEQVKEAFPKDR
jgi:hypothetical protein